MLQNSLHVRAHPISTLVLCSKPQPYSCSAHTCAPHLLQLLQLCVLTSDISTAQQSVLSPHKQRSLRGCSSGSLTSRQTPVPLPPPLTEHSQATTGINGGPIGQDVSHDSREQVFSLATKTFNAALDTEYL